MRRFLIGLYASIATLTLTAGAALAAPTTVTNPGRNIATWITDNVTALFVPLLAVMALYYLAKRQFTQFLSFAIFAVIAALFIFAGSEFKDAAVSLAKFIIGK